MQEKNEIVDVEFTEVKREPAAAPMFNPAVFLTEALIKAGLTEAAVQWCQNIDPRAETAESEKDRIFFANRALRLFLAEIEGRDNITPRMLIADGIDSVKWIALMEQGIIPWLLGQFDKKGKRVAPEAEQAEAARGETPVMHHIDEAAFVPGEEATTAVESDCCGQCEQPSDPDETTDPTAQS